MKKIFLSIFIALSSIFLISCDKSKDLDITAPVFDNLIEGKLEDLRVQLGSEVNLLEGVTAKDDLDGNIEVSILDLGGFNINVINTYEITYLAVDKSGNKSTAKRRIIVEEEIDEDNISPEFININNGYLPPLTITKGEIVNLLDGITAIDNISSNVIIEIIDNGGFNKDIAGEYLVKYKAIDENLNFSIANRIINVIESSVIKYDAFFINDSKIPFIFNNKDALNYTSLGTAFRSFDQVQIMEKEFFINLYNEKKSTHDNNGMVPFFNNGVIVILDKNMNFKHLRMATTLLEINEDFKVNTTGLTFTNALDKTNGGGLFKNIIDALNTLIPEDGYIIFAPPAGKQESKRFLINNLLSTTYASGVLNISEINIDLSQVKYEFKFGHIENITSDEYENENKNTVIAKDKIYDGIPVTTYYFNDGKKKPVIFFFHGFAGERKAGIANRGVELAELGYYVVSLDAYLHGERQPKFFADLSYGDKQKEIVNIQIQTALDAKKLYDKYYRNNKYVLSGDIYTFGVSMGAGSAIYLASIMSEVKTVISMLGSPSFVEFYKTKQVQYNWEINSDYFSNLNSYRSVDPLINHESYKDKNIFFLTGEIDTTVPKNFAQSFKDLYKNIENIKYKVYDTGHVSTKEMHDDSYEFLKKYS